MLSMPLLMVSSKLLKLDTMRSAVAFRSRAAAKWFMKDVISDVQGRSATETIGPTVGVLGRMRL